APLQIPLDSLVIDTTSMTLDEVVERIYEAALIKLRK
ncbi:MAG: (d)CMP kinase, partial [Bdellovibrionaceae bacterium]|nr:(d)CMP kinase [Pseudobdellovibrionaceae bacterium]